MARRRGPHNEQDAPKLREAKKLDLPKGMVQAIKGLQHRVPSGTHPVLESVADRAFIRLVDVMEGRVSFRQAPSVIKAATQVRDEICGPIATEVNVKGQMTLEMLVAKASTLELAGGTDPEPA
jgi:hypothetical protein